MTERKGFFGRLFGKGKTPPKDPDAPAAEEETSDETPELATAAIKTIAPQTEPLEPPSVDPEPAPKQAGTDLDQGADESAEEGLAEPAAEVPKEIPTEVLGEDQEQVPEETEAPVAEPQKKRGLFGRLTSGLARTSQKLTGGISGIFRKRKLDDDTLEELEDLLITADLGLPATTRIIEALARDKFDKEVTDEEVRAVLSDEIVRTLEPLEAPLTIDGSKTPYVILMTGVNGAGKTTTIGKLAKKLNADGYSTLLAAGDTFRAAAVEQLKVWGERTNSPVVTRDHGADAAGLAFDAINQAKTDNIDVVLIDTAGRLQNRRELMDELAKIVRVIRKLDETAPHESFLVLDATVGQNALSQAETFAQVADITGLVMTKLDGTAKGGVLVALADRFGLPIKFIGVGEGVDDLQTFRARDFARALTTEEGNAP
ncbi:MAG: signal recognition particle-docking protein FtsY [Parvularcula sp.]